MTQAQGPTNGGVAIVLSGAGSRGAYEAGALSVLLPFLRGDDRPRIVLGTSVGALNAALLAANLGQGVDAAAAALLRAWRQITPAWVFATPRLSLLRYAERWLRRPPDVAPGLLDTSPLRVTLRNLLPDEHFASAVTHGSLDAVAVAASSCAEGGAVVFLETTRPVPLPAPPPGLTYARTRLGYEHLMASSAFPLAFPAQWVEGAAEGWYIDGGIHLNTPLKPAIDLGADRILVIGATPFDVGQAPERSKPPNFMDGSGEILRALLVDSLRADLAALVRTNLQIGGGGAPPAPAATPAASSGWREVRFCALNPSDDGLSDVAARSYPSGLLPFVRSLGGYGALGPLTAQRRRPGEFLSYLCFTPEFISAAITLGIADAERLVARSGGIPWAAS